MTPARLQNAMQFDRLDALQTAPRLEPRDLKGELAARLVG